MKLPQAYKNIPGWFSDAEANYLYKLVRKTTGSILEAGTYCGRSTSCICEALRDSGARPFVSYDIACGSDQEYQEFAYILGHTKYLHMPAELHALWSQGTDSHQQAQAYLREAGLLDYVSLVKGDFRTDRSFYDVLFLDTVHGVEEVKANLPHVLRLAKKGAWVALHDMYSHMLTLIESEYGNQLKFQTLTDTLGLFTRL